MNLVNVKLMVDQIFKRIILYTSVSVNAQNKHCPIYIYIYIYISERGVISILNLLTRQIKIIFIKQNFQLYEKKF